MSLKKLSAFEELSLPQKANELIPLLLSKGLCLEDAGAVADNTALLFFALGKDKPKKIEEILHQFSLEEIAELCAQGQSSHEWGYNEGFEEGDL